MGVEPQGIYYVRLSFRKHTLCNHVLLPGGPIEERLKKSHGWTSGPLLRVVTRLALSGLNEHPATKPTKKLKATEPEDMELIPLRSQPSGRRGREGHARLDGWFTPRRSAHIHLTGHTADGRNLAAPHERWIYSLQACLDMIQASAGPRT